MRNKQSGFFVVISTIVSIIILPYFVNFIITIQTPWGFITNNDKDAWIGFYGAIIGGAITLIGVWWTINDQNKRRTEEKEELANEYMPIPKGIIINLKDNKNENIPYFNISRNSYDLKFGISIENHGRGELKNGVLKGCCVASECENGIFPKVKLKDSFIASNNTGMIEVIIQDIPRKCLYIEIYIELSYFGLYSKEQNCLFKIISIVSETNRGLSLDMDINTLYETKLSGHMGE